MKRALGVVLLLASASACVEQEQPEAKFWRVRDMWKPENELADFGGWKPRQLVATVGTPLFFEESTSLDGGLGADVAMLNDGLVVQPGVAGGVSAPFVITEIWKNHPVPWIQPVWVPRRPSTSNAPPLAVNVFSLSDDSTFYSPFWQLEIVFNEGLKDDNEGFRSARDVLSVMGAKDTRRVAGPLVFCPVLPKDVLFAQNRHGVRDPISLAAITQMDPARALAEKEVIWYRDFGSNRFAANDQLPIASRAYFWVASPGGPVLPIAAVLPNQPKARSFVTRFDISIPPAPQFATMGVYVPLSRPELRARLINGGVRAPAPSLANGDVPERALQMVRDTTCFTTGAIATCEWIDSEAAVLASGVWMNEQPVQLAIGVVGP